VFAPPDPLHLDAGSNGETLVSQIRLVLLALLLPIPLFNLAFTHDVHEAVVGLVALLVVIGIALVTYWALAREFYRPWIGLATSAFDVTAVSAALGVFLLLDSPLVTVNSRPTFECYFLAIGATSLRYDVRLCLTAGALAVVQYLGLVLLAHGLWDLSAPGQALSVYGSFDWATQASRIVLLLVATLLSAAIVLRSQRLRHQSRSDRLTGLPNRSYFDERIMGELSSARRFGAPLALAMIDVDYFKRFNDTHGHAAGDMALRAVANCILGAIRQTDLVVRYGGEEFVMLFPGMSARAAVERVEEIRRAVEVLPLALPRSPELVHITISAGVAVYGMDGVEPEDLLDRADSRLFEAKESGRDRVVGPPPAEQAEGRLWRLGDEVRGGG
jgi:diguanylate cyclase (GGDEF)-like protein